MARGAKQPGIDAGKHKEAGLHCLAAPSSVAFEDLQHYCLCVGWIDLKDHWPCFQICPQDTYFAWDAWKK